MDLKHKGGQNFAIIFIQKFIVIRGLSDSKLAVTIEF